jgi:putative membrane protein
LDYAHGGTVVNPVGSALIAAAHFIAIFTALAILAIEWALYARVLPFERLAVLRRVDLAYLFAALAIVVTGLLRLFTSPKGNAFYTHNPIFWTKMSLFVAVALLSIVPTMHYLGLPRSGDVAIAERDHARIRFFIIAELVLFALIPIAATLMARGVGL